MESGQSVSDGFQLHIAWMPVRESRHATQCLPTSSAARGTARSSSGSTGASTSMAPRAAMCEGMCYPVVIHELVQVRALQQASRIGESCAAQREDLRARQRQLVASVASMKYCSCNSRSTPLCPGPVFIYIPNCLLGSCLRRRNAYQNCLSCFQLWVTTKWG